MKTTLILISLFFLCATAALGQTASSMSSEPQMVVVPSHPQHATQHDLAQEQSLLSNSAYTYAQGERPLWEFGPVSAPPVPLGDTARAYRKEHATAKKAEIIWEK